MELKEKLAALRVEKGLSQAELAEALDVSRQAISRWEVGTSVPSMENLLRLGKLYGVSINAFVDEKDQAADGAQALDEQKEAQAVPPKVGGRVSLSRMVKWMLCAACILAIILIASLMGARQETNGVTPMEEMNKGSLDLSSAEHFSIDP